MAPRTSRDLMLDRRQLLGAFGAGAWLAACGEPDGDPTPTDTGPKPRSTPPDLAWEGVAAVDDAVFPNGVAAGDPRPDGGRLWCRYLGAAGVQVWVAEWTGDAFAEPRSIAVTPSEGGFCHVDVASIASDVWFAYQFVDDDGLGSVVGLSHTAIPSDHDGVVRVISTSCLHQEHRYSGSEPELAGVIGFVSLQRALARGPADFVVWMGDFGYFDGRESPEEYRELWLQQQRAIGISDALRGAPSVFTLDDHEVTNNFDPETIAPEHVAVAMQAFFDHTPIRPDAPGRVWRSWRYGAAVEVFVLDCRTERKPSLGLYISRAQMDWLKAGLSASTATWKLIVNSVPISEYPPFQTGDRWLGYPEQRSELMDFITGEGLSGVLFLAGDVHMNALSRVGLEGPWTGVLEILGGPGGSTLNVAAPFLRAATNFIHADAQWAATRMEFSVDGTARIVVVSETDEDLMSATIDVSGEVREIVRSYD